MGDRLKIYLREVWFKYEPMGEWVLRRITLDFTSDKTVIIRGHNGSGKTTLMKIASLIYKPTRGEVIVSGKSFWDLGEGERSDLKRRVVFVHEKPIMLRGSVRYNVKYSLKIRGIDGEGAEKRYREVAEELGLRAIEDKPSHRLSAGQAQLVAIARALVAMPEIIFLDEPFAYLDSGKRDLLIEVLRKRRKSGVGLAIVSHDMEAALRVGADLMVVMEKGEIREIAIP